MQAGKALKTAAAFMLSVAMLATGAACGTSDDSDASASKSSSKSSELTGYDVSGVKKDDAIAKMLPDYVTKDGKLTIGMDTSYAPAEFLAADGKTPVGFDVDIAKALAGVFGLEADPETANFDSIIPAVGAKYDIGISSFTVTKERLEAVDFVSHFNAGSAWAVKKGNPNKVDTSDLCGKKVAVQTATMQETAANKMAKQCKADGKAEMDVISSKLQTDVTTIPALEALPNWTEEALHATLLGLAEQNGMKNGTMLWPVRIAMAGKAVTPGGAIEIGLLLGREETLSRLKLGREKL